MTISIDADWVMVIITAVYAVTTIVMSVSNHKLFKVNREQLNIEKRHYSDALLLDHKPVLEIIEKGVIENADENITFKLTRLGKLYSNNDDDNIELINKVFCIHNTGNSIAQNVRISFIKWDDIELNFFIQHNAEITLNCLFETTKDVKDRDSELMGMIYYNNDNDVEFIQVFFSPLEKLTSILQKKVIITPPMVVDKEADYLFTKQLNDMAYGK